MTALGRLGLLVALLAAAPAWADPAQPAVADQELGARIGMDMNVAGVAPGGFHVAGLWLYRLSDRFWFDGRAAFALGGGGPDCAPATGRCDHALTDGFGATLLAGVRWFPPATGQVTPWLGGGVGAGVAYPSGGVTGLALPLWAGAGARVPVADGVAVAGEALLDVAATGYDSHVGWKGSLGLTIAFGVDFRM